MFRPDRCRKKIRKEGLAHYLEHMLFCGSTHFKPGELVKYFQDMGMQFGPDANAHTGFYETVYDILLPDGGKESLDKGFLIVEDFAGGALLLDSEVERERKVVTSGEKIKGFLILPHICVDHEVQIS